MAELLAQAEADEAPYPRPGWGARHPDVDRFLAATEAACLRSAILRWNSGEIRATAYGLDAKVEGMAAPPDVVVSSVRCIVRVDSYVVVCCNADHVRHVLPGGRREPSETTFEETARREVHEETGWLLEPSSLRQIGWLHLENLAEVPADFPFPHPDAFHAVFEGTARSRAGDSTWTDTDGYELSSDLVLATEAERFLDRDPISSAFLDLLLGAADG